MSENMKFIDIQWKISLNNNSERIAPTTELVTIIYLIVSFVEYIMKQA